MHFDPDNDPYFDPEKCNGAAVAISCAMLAFGLFFFVLFIYLLFP